MYFEKIRSLLAQHFDVSEDSITEDTCIMEDLKADSLDVVDMLMTLEDEYDISIPDDVAQDMKTVGDVASYLDENVK